MDATGTPAVNPSPYNCNRRTFGPVESPGLRNVNRLRPCSRAFDARAGHSRAKRVAEWKHVISMRVRAERAHSRRECLSCRGRGVATERRRQLGVSRFALTSAGAQHPPHPARRGVAIA